MSRGCDLSEGRVEVEHADELTRVRASLARTAAALRHAYVGADTADGYASGGKMADAQLPFLAVYTGGQYTVRPTFTAYLKAHGGVPGYNSWDGWSIDHAALAQLWAKWRNL